MLNQDDCSADFCSIKASESAIFEVSRVTGGCYLSRVEEYNLKLVRSCSQMQRNTHWTSTALPEL